MRRDLIPSRYAEYKTCDNPIELDDESSGSHAVYLAHNPNHETFYYYKPDEHKPSEPRCDYFLISNSIDITPRFIELKGSDKSRMGKSGLTEWGHAFHQLYNTYEEFKTYIDSKEMVFVLCTSIDDRKRTSARYKKYKWYKKLQNMPGKIIVLYRDDYDVFD